MSVLLKVDNVKKIFGDVRAVDGVSFEVEQGVTTAIIGANGAGKTTLFNIISKMLVPDSGKLIFEGEDITKSTPQQVINKGMVKSFQISSLFEELTCFECIRMAVISLKRKGLNIFSNVNHIAEINEKVEEIIETFGLQDHAYSFTKELPHGCRKQLDVAIAFALEPKVLLLDEPTSGMSFADKARTMELIEKLNKESDVTISLIEHDMDVVYSLAKDLIVMHEGKILATGTPKELVDDPIVREVYFGESDITA